MTKMRNIIIQRADICGCIVDNFFLTKKPRICGKCVADMEGSRYRVDKPEKPCVSCKLREA